MSSQNIPPPPQYPNYSLVDNIETVISKDNSLMENSVIYISDGGSQNYKSNRQMGFPRCTHQMLPNLVNSINSTYHNLPPKSPKSDYRNIINNMGVAQKSNQWRQGEQQTEPYRPPQVTAGGRQNQQLWMMRPCEGVCENGLLRERQETINPTSAKTRSHPNLMNDYVNLAGAETILNDILYNRSNRPFIPATNDSNHNYMIKPQQMNHDQFSTAMGGGPQSSEFVRNGLQMYPSHGLADYAANPDNFSTESNRLVNLLLEENKRLRSKLRQSDSRLESVDQLELKIHNLEILFEELLTSQRRQRLLDLQLQQASLTNYIVNSVSPNDVVTSTGCAVTSSDNNNKLVDLRKTLVSSNQSIIPSSPIMDQKLCTESPDDASVTFKSKQQKDANKTDCGGKERYLMENDLSGLWMEQSAPGPSADNGANLGQAQVEKMSDDDLSAKLKETIKSLQTATVPYFNRVPDKEHFLSSSPCDLLGRRVTVSPVGSPARSWLLPHGSSPPSYRLRLSQQHAGQAPPSPNSTSAMKFISS